MSDISDPNYSPQPRHEMGQPNNPDMHAMHASHDAMHASHDAMHADNLDSVLNPRLERLFRSRSATMPSGLSERIFQASAPMLPADDEAPLVLARISYTYRWFAAAAALVLASGLAFRLMTLTSANDASDLSLTVVIESSDGTVLGETFSNLNATRGMRIDDLDAEMQQLFAEGRVDG